MIEPPKMDATPGGVVRFETTADVAREIRAIDTFVKSFRGGPGSFKKLGPNDIDFRVFNYNGRVVAHAEVKGRLQRSGSFPLSVGLCKLGRLIESSGTERVEPVIIWACDDGIIYARLFHLTGELRFGGRREPRPGAANDREFMAYFYDQPGLKFLAYTDEP